jgi:hypothetical protein
LGGLIGGAENATSGGKLVCIGLGLVFRDLDCCASAPLWMIPGRVLPGGGNLLPREVTSGFPSFESLFVAERSSVGNTVARASLAFAGAYFFIISCSGISTLNPIYNVPMLGTHKTRLVNRP